MDAFIIFSNASHQPKNKVDFLVVAIVVRSFVVCHGFQRRPELFAFYRSLKVTLEIEKEIH